MEQRIKELSQRCADTHSDNDIWEHLEEELAELLLAIKRVRRRREPIINAIEELIDVKIEVNTVLTMINRKDIVDRMLAKKLDKFEGMLDKEKETYGYQGRILSVVDRYQPIPRILGDMEV